MGADKIRELRADLKRAMDFVYGDELDAPWYRECVLLLRKMDKKLDALDLAQPQGCKGCVCDGCLLRKRGSCNVPLSAVVTYCGVVHYAPAAPAKEKEPTP